MTLDLAAAACLLFVPGDRADRFAKAAAASPEGIVLDLEDAVADTAKETARRSIAEFLAARSDATVPCLVRINAPQTRAGLDDLAALADRVLAPDGIAIPKVESARDVNLVRAHDPGGRPLLATIETAEGLEAAAVIARALAPSDAVGFGGADLAADLGAECAFEPLLAARSRIVAAAAVGGVAAFDVPFLDVRDADGCREEARRVRALGFTGKLAIHPAQVAPVREAFAPTPEELERAERIVRAWEGGKGAIRVDGRMVDPPVAAAARRVLARARPRGGEPTS